VREGSDGGLVLVGVGANLPSFRGPPRATCDAALAAIGEAGAAVVRCSRWYRSAPVPPSSKPWFVNGVAVIDTALDPVALLALLHAIERRFGRERDGRWTPRTLDLDLLDYRGRICCAPPPVLPHPRLHERAFVLHPLAEVAPGWRHPRLHRSVEALVAALPAGQEIELMPS
jgi:2-amino-4-hydroxy-6-hydroxymethyldihydropteridine diphosphokinase